MSTVPDARRRERRRALIAAAVPVAGVQEVVVEIAGLSIGVRVEDAAYRGKVAAAFRRFGGAGATCDSPGKIDASLDIRVAQAPADLWQDSTAEPRQLDLSGAIGIEHRDFVGRLDPMTCAMTTVQPRRIRATENALRVLSGLLLLRRDGLLLHAAGLVRRRGATVLFGSSGSGKSTAASLSRGRPVLGDDLVALRRERTGWMAHATPFGGFAGRIRASRAAPLHALYRLRHGGEFQVRAVPSARGVAELLQSVVLPAATPADRALALDRCVRLQADVGVRELAFPVDHGLWRWLDAHEL